MDVKAPFWVAPISRYISSRPDPEGLEGLSTALAERLRDVLPAGEFRVEQRGRTLTVSSVGVPGASLDGVAFVPLRLPLPMRLRLRLFFENEARDLQEFVSQVKGQPWPAPGAQPHVRVDRDAVRVWYGGPSEENAALHFGSFHRAELGM